MKANDRGTTTVKAKITDRAGLIGGPRPENQELEGGQDDEVDAQGEEPPAEPLAELPGEGTRGERMRYVSASDAACTPTWAKKSSSRVGARSATIARPSRRRRLQLAQPSRHTAVQSWPPRPSAARPRRRAGEAAVPESARDAAMRLLHGVKRRAQGDPALADHRDVIGDLLHLVQQVRRKEHRAAFVGDGADDGAEDVAADDGIEAGRRLVEHQQLGPIRECYEEPGPRLLALGEGLDPGRGVEREHLPQLLRVRIVPAGVERARVADQLVDASSSRGGRSPRRDSRSATGRRPARRRGRGRRRAPSRFPAAAGPGRA